MAENAGAAINRQASQAAWVGRSQVPIVRARIEPPEWGNRMGIIVGPGASRKEEGKQAGSRTGGWRRAENAEDEGGGGEGRRSLGSQGGAMMPERSPCRGGETGRRTGLKILGLARVDLASIWWTSCGFDLRPPSREVNPYRCGVSPTSDRPFDHGGGSKSHRFSHRRTQPEVQEPW